jgi:hypothetical protein
MGKRGGTAAREEKGGSPECVEIVKPLHLFTVLQCGRADAKSSQTRTIKFSALKKDLRVLSWREQRGECCNGVVKGEV